MAQAVFDSIIEQPVFRTYLFYVAILGLKMLLMSVLTGSQRFKNKAFANPEDAAIKKLKVKVSEDVERVRRAHLNDLENIPIFIIVALAYLTTNPSALVATTLIRLFTAARIVHSLVYAVVVVPQPARALAFGVGFLTTIFMGVKTVLYYL